MLVESLGKALKQELPKATEFYMAVALLNESGCRTILEALRNTCKVEAIVGIDLPTQPQAMELLLLDSRVAPFVFSGKGRNFHPKVYLLRQGNIWKAFVGSANGTGGGLEKNIEMNIEVQEQASCEQLKIWFDGLRSQASLIDEAWIEDYKPKYARRIEQRSVDRQTVSSIKADVDKLVERIQLSSAIQFGEFDNAGKRYSDYTPAEVKTIIEKDCLIEGRWCLQKKRMLVNYSGDRNLGKLNVWIYHTLPKLVASRKKNPNGKNSGCLKNSIES